MSYKDEERKLFEICIITNKILWNFPLLCDIMLLIMFTWRINMIKKVLSLIKSNKILKWALTIYPCAIYSKYIKKKPINNKLILLEAQHGGEISGNIFYILKELTSNEAYSSYKIYLSCKAPTKEKIKNILDTYGIKNVNLIIVLSPKYMKIAATAKYLFNDNTFLPFFTKREEQIYLNTWHGTPLKTLGKGIKNAMHNIGNTQKNFVAADYLLYPNTYTMEHMLEDYMLPNLAKGKCVLSGYPRNTVFFDAKRREELRKSFGGENKKIYAYMPTWRGAIGNISKDANTQMTEYLNEIDSQLADDEILYVNLHPIAVKNVEFGGFKHIKKFPADLETYDFLNCTDCLITDYSSVFYDYAVTRKKCVLFTYDAEEYFADRGVYKSIDDLPFPQVKTVEELIKEIRSDKQYDDTDFLEEYCAYDCEDATKNILKLVFDSATSEKPILKEIPCNNKKNILIQAGNLDQNGVTASLYNLLKNIDTKENNYYICFPTGKAKDRQSTIADLPEGVGYFPMHDKMNLGLIKNVFWYTFLATCFMKKNFMKVNFIERLMKNEWKYEITRLFGGAKFDHAIQFTGYGPKMILFFANFDCKTTIYVHSDMRKEIETRGNQREDVLKFAYKNYDNVALVTEDIFEPISTFVDNTDNFKIAHNVIAYEEILKRGEQEIQFEDGVTQSNKSFEEIKKIVESDAKKIISVGRFSPEKDHKRMVDAFNKIWCENKDSYFIIIGGNQYNNHYDILKDYIKNLECCNNIILIMTMKNPLPIVKRCDGFILASHYEGFGLVLAEADILGLPVVSTDIVGPRTFMNKNNGTLVENTPEGVEKGFRLLIEGKVPMLTTDYKKYNENAVNEFIALLD